jgi:hypothetical protein
LAQSIWWHWPCARAARESVASPAEWKDVCRDPAKAFFVWKGGKAMNQSSIMKAAAVVSAIFGLALLLAPNQLITLYKAEEMNGPGIYNSMLYGGTLIAVALMNWTASNASAAEAGHVIRGTLLGYAIGLLVVLIRQLTDPSVPPAAWLNVAIFAVFTGLYAYLQFSGEKLGSSGFRSHA